MRKLRRPRKVPRHRGRPAGVLLSVAALATVVCGSPGGVARSATPPDTPSLPTAACSADTAELDTGDPGPKLKTPYPPSFAMPFPQDLPTATAFVSPTFSGTPAVILGPSTGKCVTQYGLSDVFQQRITLPGDPLPSVEVVLGTGDNGTFDDACRYLPQVRALPGALKDPRCRKATSVVENLTPIGTGVPNLYAVVVRVARRTTDPDFATAGGVNETLALMIAYNYGGEPDINGAPDGKSVGAPWADCQLSSAGTAACEAELKLFASQILPGLPGVTGKAVGNVWAGVEAAAGATPGAPTTAAPPKAPATTSDKGEQECTKTVGHSTGATSETVNKALNKALDKLRQQKTGLPAADIATPPTLAGHLEVGFSVAELDACAEGLEPLLSPDTAGFTSGQMLVEADHVGASGTGRGPFLYDIHRLAWSTPGDPTTPLIPPGQQLVNTLEHPQVRPEFTPHLNISKSGPELDVASVSLAAQVTKVDLVADSDALLEFEVGPSLDLTWVINKEDLEKDAEADAEELGSLAEGEAAAADEVSVDLVDALAELLSTSFDVGLDVSVGTELYGESLAQMALAISADADIPAAVALDEALSGAEGESAVVGISEAEVLDAEAGSLGEISLGEMFGGIGVEDLLALLLL